MKRRYRYPVIVAIVILWAVLMLWTTRLYGQTNCPDQVFLDPNTCPTALDQTKIAVDPESKKKLPLGWRYVSLGGTVSITGRYCDKEGDPVLVTLSGTVPTDAALTVNGTAMTYALTYKPSVQWTKGRRRTIPRCGSGPGPSSAFPPISRRSSIEPAYDSLVRPS